jgi:hypothetical protein
MVGLLHSFLLLELEKSWSIIKNMLACREVALSKNSVLEGQLTLLFC